MTEMKDKELHRVAVTCIIYNSEDKYLVTKRSPHKKVYPNKWTVPGGGLTTDDYMHKPANADGCWYGAVEECLRREVREEVGLEIGKPEYLLDLTLMRPDGIPVVVLSFYAPYESGEVVLDEDSVEHAWVSLDEAKGVDLIDGIYSELAAADARRKGIQTEGSRA